MNLTINDKHYSECEAGEFEALIRQAGSVSDVEIWLNHQDGPALCALMNANGGWLMFLREEGDAGFSSRNPAIDPGDGATETYRLANGQMDEYPRAWAFERSDVFDALREFFRTGQRPGSVGWYEDA